MDLSLSGKVVEIVPPVTYNTKNGERIRYGFVIETEDRYPRKVKFSVEDTQRWDTANIQLNQMVRVAFNLESHSYTGQRGVIWFTEAKAWKIEQLAATQTQPTATVAAQTQAQTQTPSPSPNEGAGKDLPF